MVGTEIQYIIQIDDIMLIEVSLQQVILIFFIIKCCHLKTQDDYVSTRI